MSEDDRASVRTTEDPTKNRPVSRVPIAPLLGPLATLGAAGVSELVSPASAAQRDKNTEGRK